MNKKTKSEGLDRIPTGIAGFDRLSGGLPRGRISLLLGPTGAGKTVFSLQTLVNCARRGEPGVFLSFSERAAHLVENSASFGWDLPELEKERLVFLDARSCFGAAKAGQFDVVGMVAGLQAVAREIGAKHVVLDSIDVLLTLLDSPSGGLQELFRIRDWLIDNGLTGLITASETQSSQPLNLLQSIADCVVTLEFRTQPRTALRHLRIIKFRGAHSSAEAIPFIIGETGIETAGWPISRASASTEGRGAVHPEIELARKELTARVQELDRFLEMKQAELGFLMEKGSARMATAPASRTPQASRRGMRSAPK